VAAITASSGVLGCYCDIVDAGCAGFVHHRDQRLGFGLPVGLDNHRTLRVFGVQTFDIWPYCTDVDFPAVDPDVIVGTDRDQDIGFFLFNGSCSIRSVYFDTRFLDKGCGYDSMINTTSSMGVMLISDSSSCWFWAPNWRMFVLLV
jgi:hypothetical protein